MDFDLAMNKAFKTFIYPEVLFFKEEARMIYNAVKEMNAKRVLELGVGNGSSTIALLATVEDTGGRLISVDIVDNPWFNVNTPEKVKEIGLEKYWEFIKMNDLDYAKQCEEKFEVILVDTDHTYNQTYNEVNAFTPLMESYGEMYFHDALHGEEGTFINKAVTDFMREQKAKRVNYIYTIFPTTCGMGKLIKA